MEKKKNNKLCKRPHPPGTRFFAPPARHPTGRERDTKEKFLCVFPRHIEIFSSPPPPRKIGSFFF